MTVRAPYYNFIFYFPFFLFQDVTLCSELSNSPHKCSFLEFKISMTALMTLAPSAVFFSGKRLANKMYEEKQSTCKKLW